ncbi:hypothetical protein [Clostridium sp. C8-1-8]|uniref:hypothetical protein n=1 Tax=Clostridium sp. C8-1-8 TaxID=2698831 RepID=UPI00136C415C|nr:hypothetical protein [Clostridium sp. C8-1-8]
MGDISKGVFIYCSNSLSKNKGWQTLAGTSLGTPCWAAFIAIANEASGTRFKNMHGKLYYMAKNDKDHTNFNDIIKGDNGELYAKDG